MVERRRRPGRAGRAAARSARRSASSDSGTAPARGGKLVGLGLGFADQAYYLPLRHEGDAATCRSTSCRRGHAAAARPRAARPRRQGDAAGAARRSTAAALPLGLQHAPRGLPARRRLARPPPRGPRPRLPGHGPGQHRPAAGHRPQRAPALGDARRRRRAITRRGRAGPCSTSGPGSTPRCATSASTTSSTRSSCRWPACSPTMESEGVAIDVPYLEEIAGRARRPAGRDRDRGRTLPGDRGQKFNLNAPQQLAKFLFEDLRLPVGKRTKTGYSTDAETLEALRDKHPIIGLILEHRQLSKLKSTYVDSLPQLVDPRDGRVHTSFGQAITATGRLSQQQPQPDEHPDPDRARPAHPARLHRRPAGPPCCSAPTTRRSSSGSPPISARTPTC